MMTIPFETVARGMVAGALASALSVWFQTGLASPAGTRLGSRLGAVVDVERCADAQARAVGEIQTQHLADADNDGHG
jgi:hypothetical protein